VRSASAVSADPIFCGISDFAAKCCQNGFATFYQAQAQARIPISSAEQSSPDARAFREISEALDHAPWPPPPQSLSSQMPRKKLSCSTLEVKNPTPATAAEQKGRKVHSQVFATDAAMQRRAQARKALLRRRSRLGQAERSRLMCREGAAMRPLRAKSRRFTRRLTLRSGPG
jgi:hypothetical protein